MTCKDCVHYEMCKEWCSGIDEYIDPKGKENQEPCEHYKDKTRFVELPCKAGDTIYFVCGYNMSEYTVKSIMYDNIFWQFDCENDMYAVEHRHFSFFDERIGKTVFLTREEAEKALERSQSNEI